MTVARVVPKIFLNLFPEANLIAKTLNQPHPSVMGNMSFLEGNIVFSDSFRHHTQDTPLGAFVCENFLSDSSNSSSSVISHRPRSNHGLFTLF